MLIYLIIICWFNTHNELYRLSSASLFTSDLDDHLFDLQSELIPAAASWKSIGVALRLKPDFLQSIDTWYSGDPRVCLSWMVMEWLKRNYNVEKFGEPSWRMLVDAVGNPAGGANMALAMDIARRHKARGLSSGSFVVTVSNKQILIVEKGKHMGGSVPNEKSQGISQCEL